MYNTKKQSEINEPIKANVAQDVEPVVSSRRFRFFDFSKLVSRMTFRVLIAGGILMIGLIGMGLFGYRMQNRKLNITITQQSNKQGISVSNSKDHKEKAVVAVGAPASNTDTTPSKSTSGSTLAPKISAPAPVSSTPPSGSTPAPANPPAPPNTTNCLPPNPGQYDTYYIGKTNSQYLQTNSYVTTTKLYSALQFAGLINTVNTKQYVVLAMDDSAWSALTQAQLDYMNASPANMRSVLGWQIITSCITWKGVNPVQDLPVGTTLTVNTINGPVTFTARASGGLGTFGNARVGIWDWFTSNGAVTIAGFVKTP